MNFEDLKLIEPILKALKDQNYREPTEIKTNSEKKEFEKQNKNANKNFCQ